MPAFPSTRIPDRASALWLPTGLRDPGHTGIIQQRVTKQVGWTWEESWNLLNARNDVDAKLISQINYFWNRMVMFTITHPLVRGSGLAPGGLGTAGVQVNGGSQTGGTLSTKLWPNSVAVVKAGDVIRIAGDSAVYQVWDDASSNGSGIASLSIVPNLRKSPANSAAITTTGVTFDAIIIERSRYESNKSPSYYADMMVRFRELLS